MLQVPANVQSVDPFQYKSGLPLLCLEHAHAERNLLVRGKANLVFVLPEVLFLHQARKGKVLQNTYLAETDQQIRAHFQFHFQLLYICLHVGRKN